MAGIKPDYDGMFDELEKAGIDEITCGPGGILMLDPQYFEGIDDKTGASCVINRPIGRRAFPGKFGFFIEEGDKNGENFVILVPGRAS